MRKKSKQSMSILISFLLCLNHFVVPAMAEEENVPEVTEEPVTEVIEETAEEEPSKVIETPDETLVEEIVPEEETKEESSEIDKNDEEGSTETEESTEPLMEMADGKSEEKTVIEPEVQEEVEEVSEAYATYGDFEYSVSNGEVTITKYTGSNAEVEIPSEIDGYLVTCIGTTAFYECSSVTGVKISNSVNSIGDGAFLYCTNLTSITIPDGVTSIGRYVFSRCTSLTSITISDSVTHLEHDTFTHCPNITSIIVDENNAIYDSRDGCNAIIETKTNTLITGCSKTIIPNGVESIGQSAFVGCTNLINLKIPSSVTNIDIYAFDECNNLSSINVDKDNKIYDSRNNCNAIVKTEHNMLVLGCETTVIPETIERIGNLAFRDCSNLKSITIPESVWSIGYAAFYNCNNLENIQLSDNITSIDTQAFSHCTKLKKFDIPKKLKKIPNLAFENCFELTEITIPNNITVIDGAAFSGCRKLKSIHIPASVTNLDSGICMGCHKLQSITVDENNPVYDSRNNCNAIIESASNNLIVGCNNTVIPDGIVTISSCAFDSRVDLTNIMIPDSVAEIGSWAFNKCISLKKVEIPTKVTTLPERVFYDCYELTTLTIPDSVINIGEEAFDNCYELKDVNYSGTKEQWKQISIDNGNDYLLNATIHYGSEGETEDNIPIIVIPGIMGSELYDYVKEHYDAKAWHKIWVEDAFTVGLPISAIFEYYGPNFTNETVGVTRQPVRDDIIPYYETLPSGLTLDRVVSAALIKEAASQSERESNSEYGTINTYKVLIETVCTEYPNRDVYLYAYDWRKSNTKSAEHLFELMKETNIEKADILAHSMGGLVLSQFVEQGHEEMINHSITFGTPYEGANKCLKVILTNTVLENPFDNVFAIEGLGPEIKQQFDGVAELLPTEEYISYEEKAYHDYLYTEESSETKQDKSKKFFFRNDQFDLGKAQNQLVINKSSDGKYRVKKNWISKIHKVLKNPYDSTAFQTWLTNIKDAQNNPAELKALKSIVIEPTGSGKAAGYIFYPEYMYYDKNTLKPVDYSAVLRSVFWGQRYEKIIEAQRSARSGYQKLQNMDNAYFAIGKDKWTLTGLSMMRNNDGIIEYVDCVSNKNGDGTVPFYSANQLNSKQNLHNATYYKLNHGGLVGDDEKKNAQYSTEWPKVKAWMLNILNGTYDSNRSSVSEQFSSENEEPITNIKTLRFEGNAVVTIRSGEEYLSNSADSFCDNASFGCMEILGTMGNILVFSIDEGTEYTIDCTALEEGVIDFTEKLFEDGEVTSSVNYPAIIVEKDSEITIQDNENTPIISIDYEKDGTSDLIIDSTVVEYNINSAFSEGGSVGPNESYYVSEGANTSLTIVADEDYCISYILINGERYSETAVNGLTEYTLSFENVSENYNVFVQFRKIGEPDLTDIGDVLLEDVPADGIIPEGVWIAGIRNQVYTGSAIKQSFRVYDGKTMLKEKTDYTVTYKNTTNAYTFQGTDQDYPTANDKKKAPQIIIKSNSKGNYKGSRTVYFSIEPVNIETDEQVYIENEITLKETAKVQRPVPVITFNGKTVSSKEYTLTYLDGEGNVLDKKTGPKTAGTYMIRIEGNNKNFTGTKDVSLTISDTTTKEKAVALSKAVTVTAAAAEYDGTAKNTAVIANKAGYELTEGKDYTVAYTKNVNAGTATVTATGKGIYTGTVKKTFKITPRLYAEHTDEFRFEVSDAVYSKGGAIPEVHVFWDDNELKAGTDYTLKYANNKKVTDEFVSKWPTVTITFKGNYKGAVTKDFFIDPKPLDQVSIVSKDKVYSAKANAWKSAPVLKDTDGKTLKAGTDYEKTITYTTANDAELPAVVEAGTVVKVTVTGKGNYTDTVSTAYRILETGKDISKAAFKIAQKEYTGSEVTLTEADITATINKTTPLKLGTDYVIDSYTNNLKKGTAKVTFRGINGYGGTKTVSFKIGQRSIADYWQGVKDFFSRMF